VAIGAGQPTSDGEPTISVQQMLDVVADFDQSGGVSLGLVAWELCVDEPQVLPAWNKAKAEELLTPVHRDVGGELWRRPQPASRRLSGLSSNFGDDPHGHTVTGSRVSRPVRFFSATRRA